MSQRNGISADVEIRARRRAAADIALVVAVSAFAYGAELALQDVLPWGEEARGVLAVLAGAVAALWITASGSGSLADLGFRRPLRWRTVPIWVAGIMITFILAQAAAPPLVGAFFDLPQPDLSRYDFIRGNLPAALAMILVLPLTAAIPEEVLYRGFLLDRVARLLGAGRTGLFLAVLAQAAVFGVVHFEWGAGGVLLTCLMGAVWGFAFVLCGRNLWIVILAHSAAHVALVMQIYVS